MPRKSSVKNETLEDYLLSSSHGLKSIGGLTVSGIISTFGVYSLIKPFFEEGSSSLTVAIISFIIVLMIFDTIKRGSLTKYFNSLLKKKIMGTKKKIGYLVIAIFAALFMFLLGAVGSWSTAEKGAALYSQSKTNSSTEYQILQQNAENGKAAAQNYTIQLETWRESKNQAYANCEDKWRGWKAKYKAECKEKWSAANPMPTQTATGQIKIDDYTSIKNSQKSFLDEYLFYILFGLLLLLTLLTEYLTISKIYDDYNEIEESLTYQQIEFIRDYIQERQTIQADHERKTFEMLANAKREENIHDLKFREVGKAIAITHKKKNVDTRAKTVMRIANDEYVPKEESKSAFFVNSMVKDTNAKPSGHKVLDLNNEGLYYSHLRKHDSLTLRFFEKEIHLDKELLDKAYEHFSNHDKFDDITFLDMQKFTESLNEDDVEDNNSEKPKHFQKENSFDEQKYLYEMFWDGTSKTGYQLKARDEMSYFSSNSHDKREQLNKFIKKLINEKVIHVTKNATFALMNYVEARRAVGVAKMIKNNQGD